MAMFYALSKWRHYLEEGTFIIKIDQKSIKNLLEQRLYSMIQQRGIIKLLGLDYKIQYKKGVENVVVDALGGRFYSFHGSSSLALGGRKELDE